MKRVWSDARVALLTSAGHAERSSERTPAPPIVPLISSVDGIAAAFVCHTRRWSEQSYAQMAAMHGRPERIDMKPITGRDLALAVAITAVWGFNFVVIRIGVDVIPPLMLSAARFLFAAIPLVFFVPRPVMPFGTFLGIAIMLGIFSFALLFIGIDVGLSPGIASLVLQSQVFFTAAFAVIFFGETIARHQVSGIAVAFFGIAILVYTSGVDGTILGLLVVIGAAISWAISNLFMKRSSQVNMWSLMVWLSLVPPIPLFILSLKFEGLDANVLAWENLDMLRIGAVLYLAFAATVFGFGGWAMLIARYGAGRIAPFSLLVPVFGMAASALVLGESFDSLRMSAAVLILCGLALTIRTPTRRRKAVRQ